MSEKLGSIVTAGGDFITRAASGGTVSAGNTGTLATLTPPAGQRVRLTHLSTAAGGNQAGISVLIGAEAVVSELLLDGAVPATITRFSVGNFQPYAGGTPPFGNYHQFTGGVNEALTILKNTGNTAVTIYYGYEFGL